MVRGVCLGLAFCFSMQAQAEFSAMQALLVPALIGVTNRRLDNDFQKDLNLDPRATAPFYNTKRDTSCSGRFLNPTTALMAAHCVRKGKSNSAVVMNVEGVDSIGIFKSDTYPEIDADDIALVVFPEGTGEFLGIKSYAPMAEKAFETGRAFVVGYGRESEFVRTAFSGAGVKGWGEFNIVGRKEGMLVTESGYYSSSQREKDADVGKKVVALSGDSGASVYNEQGEIVAVVSQRILDLRKEKQTVAETFFGFPTGRDIEVEVSIPTGAHNYLIDVTSENSRKVFRDAIVCKTPPCAANFVGSGVTENEAPVRLESLQPVDNKLFSHRTLRTGRYHSKNEEFDLYLHTQFKGNRLLAVQLHMFGVENEVSPEISLFCKDNRCTDRGFGIMELDNPESDVVVLTGRIPGRPDVVSRYELVPE